MVDVTTVATSVRRTRTGMMDEVAVIGVLEAVAERGVVVGAVSTAAECRVPGIGRLWRI